MDKSNHVVLAGNLGADAETKPTSSGGTLTALTLATNTTWKDAAGEPQKRTDWHKVTIYDQAHGERASQFKKGDFVRVEGRLESRAYTDSEGRRHKDVHISVRRFDKIELVASAGLRENARPVQSRTPQLAS